MGWTVFYLAALAFLAPLLYRFFQTKAVWIFVFSLFTIFLYFTSYLFQGDRIEGQHTMSWVEELGIHLLFRVDGLSLTFALLISFIGASVFLYCKNYMEQYTKYGLGSFYACLLLFTAAMLGLVLSDHMIQLYVFWELTSITSFFLIGFKSTTDEARQAATKSLLVTAAGGLSLLAGIILISLAAQDAGLSLTESMQISQLSTINLNTHTFYPWIIVCLLGAVLTKSAQFPFYFWLPSAMFGPTPVSSYLHSATMVKAGIFLLARLYPTLADHVWWNILVTGFGLTTMLVGAFLTLAFRDIKKILAYSTIFVLGVLTMLLGLGGTAAIEAAVVYLIAHALYKAALFQVVGNIDYATGSRDIVSLSGLKTFMPGTAFAAVLACLSQAGFPPFLGFYGKDLLYLAGLNGSWPGYWLPAMTFIASILIAGASFGILYYPFFRKTIQQKNERIIKKLPLTMTLPPVILATLGLLIGLFPRILDIKLSSSIASAIFGSELHFKLKLWHGLSLSTILVLLLSFFTLSLGILLARHYFSLIKLVHGLSQKFAVWGPDQFYSRFMSFAIHGSTSLTNYFQSGNLSQYLRSALLGLVIFMIYPFWKLIKGVTGIHLPMGDMIDAGILLMGAFSAIAALAFKRHMQILAVIAAVGLTMILIFSLYSAPDLALTLTMVETLSVVFIILIFRKLPKKSQPIDGLPRWIHGICAVCCGFGLSLFLLLSPEPTDKSVSTYFIEKSIPEAFGLNVVNVILVDFRSLDTLGEVLAIAIAAIAVYALLTAGNGKRIKGNSLP